MDVRIPVESFLTSDIVDILLFTSIILLVSSSSFEISLEMKSNSFWNGLNLLFFNSLTTSLSALAYVQLIWSSKLYPRCLFPNKSIYSTEGFGKMKFEKSPAILTYSFSSEKSQVP